LGRAVKSYTVQLQNPVTVEGEPQPANDTASPRFDRVAVSSWFPYRGKDERGRERQYHGAIVNRVLMASEWLAAAIEAQPERQDELIGDHVAGFR
jgi:hypothetical protein